MHMSEINQPPYAKQSFPAPTMMDLNAKLPPADVANPFANGGSIPETKFNADINSDAPMSFKSSSSNPHDMPLPHGRGYGEFNQADEKPTQVVTRVTSDTIMKGDTATVQDTGKAHG